MNLSRFFYTGVFIVSGLLMALQIIQSRIFSVTTWYHLSFLVISVAMFGLTLGALSVHRGDPGAQRKNHAQLMAEATFRFAFFTFVALIGQMRLPVVSDELSQTLFTLPVMSVLTLLPFYQAGIVLSLAITRAPYPPARTYGVDLIGAAAGCLFALGIMETLDAPSAVMALSLLALAATACFASLPWRRILLTGGLIAALLAVNLLADKPVVYPVWSKSHLMPMSTLVHDSWNSISRVTVSEEQKNVPPYLWGPSQNIPDTVRTSWYELLIDGDASTPINIWSGKDRGKELGFLDYDVTTIAYAMPNLQSAAIIGLGGGRDVLSALHAGIREVTALDVNKVQISLLSEVEPFKSYANISRQPGVRLIHSEARSWLSRNPDRFDLIQMSLVDTWAATGAGAFALSENGLYTVEAWKTFLARLNPGGVITVSRWYMRDAQSEGERLISLAMAALFESGAKEPVRHIFVAASSSIITLVLGHDPLVPAQVRALEKRARDQGFDILLSPLKPRETGAFARITGAEDWAALETIARGSIFDISAPTDRRPFFFNQVRLENPLLVLKLVLETGRSAMVGHAHAIMNLYFIIIFSFLMVLFTVLYPLRGALKPPRRSFVGAGTAWFLLIGLGFMLLEISLLQRMSVYLGHPAYGLSVVLFSLVLSTGIGSLASDRWPLSTNRKRLLWALGTALAIIASVFYIEGMMAALSDASLASRAILCLSLTLPLGFLMGFGFPTGMLLAGKENPGATAWFWGINGAAGVMGGGLAIAFNIGAGIDFTMFLAALCYAALVIPGVRR